MKATQLRHVRRRPWLLILSPAVVLIIIGVVLGILLVGGMLNTGNTANSDSSCGGQNPGAADTVPVAVTGVAGGLTAEQLSNARILAGVALGMKLGRHGVRIVLVTAWTEATLVNVNYGDMMGPGGTMSSSRGLFQQLNPWGPLADRLDPVKATTMFLTGGQAGQKGLLDIAGWASMPIPQAAQAVQQSEFSDGSNYARALPITDAITDAILAGQNVPEEPDPSVLTAAPAAPASGAPVPVAAGAGCSVPGAGGGLTTVIQNGVDVTIPDHPDVVPALRGRVIQAPNEGIAKGLAAGFAYLGYPYVWGGGDNGAGPNDGCGRGGGDFNACQGLTGFDCSGLTAYVAVAGGFTSPGGNSSAQRASSSVPWASGLPGDIIGFPGHVAVYLGMIDGVQYILEASWVGTPIHVVPLTRKDADQRMYRYYVASPA